jgi:hypothetical protein
MIDPIAYAYTTFLRRGVANKSDPGFSRGSAIGMAVFPLLPPIESIGRIGGWAITGRWPSTSDTDFLGGVVSGPWMVATLALSLVIAFACYERRRSTLLAAFADYPLPSTSRVVVMYFAVVIGALVVDYSCVYRPPLGLGLYALAFSSSAALVARIRKKRAGSD